MQGQNSSSINNNNAVHHNGVKLNNGKHNGVLTHKENGGGNDKINNYEFVRLLVQALDELGFEQSSQMLEKESGVFLQSPAVSDFCKGILQGNWELVEKRIADLGVEDKEDLLNIRFLLYQQKFLELLEEKKIKQALECLRNDISVLNRDPSKVHRLSSFILCTSMDDLQLKSGWDGARGNSRNQLLKDLRAFIPPHILLPEHRLKSLIQQAIQLQTSTCLYHNIVDEDVSLLQDHVCTSHKIPTITKHILEKHTDEVWYIKFSHNGRYLASASKDTTIVIWSVIEPEVKVLRVLTGHIAAISFVSWSPDDKLILSCGNDNLVKLWDANTGACLKTISRHTESVTAVAWLPDSKRFVSGGIDKNIFMMDLQGNELRSWAPARVNDLAITPDGRFLVVICQEKKLRIYDLENRTEDYIQETESPTSLELSADGKQVLVNISSHEIHSWDIANRRLVQKYRGQKQSRFVIRSCFGGAGQAFVISGSEDSQVYIWHRANGALLKVLPGHSGTVNTVSWNPVDPSMFASCSDDHTIRIWTCDTPSVKSTYSKRKQQEPL